MNHRKTALVIAVLFGILACTFGFYGSPESEASTGAITLNGVAYDNLQGAIDDASPGDVVTLSADIDLGTEQVTIDKTITIDGKDHAIESSGSYVIVIDGTDITVEIKDSVIKATNSAKTGRCIGIGTATPVTNVDVTLSGCTLETTQRGITVTSDNNDDVNITVISSTISLMNGITNYDQEVNATNDYNNSRGISIWDLNNSVVKVSSSTIQGFYYPINIPLRDNENLDVIIEKSIIKGRCVINNWSSGITTTIDQVNATCINTFGGNQEYFSCITGNDTGSNNEYIINDSKFNVYMNDVAIQNPKAKQFLYRASDETSVLEVDKNSVKGGTVYSVYEGKGGIRESNGTVRIYGGEYGIIDDLTSESGFVPTGYDIVTINGVQYVGKAPESNDSNILEFTEDSVVVDLGTTSSAIISMPTATISVNSSDDLNAISVAVQNARFEEAPTAVASFEITIVTTASYTADITVDAIIPDGYQALVYYIDEDGNLVPVMVVDYTSTTVTFRTTHTTPFVIMAEEIADTPTTPVEDEDDYPFPPGQGANQGTTTNKNSSDDDTKIIAAAAAVVVIMLAAVALMVNRNN